MHKKVFIIEDEILAVERVKRLLSEIDGSIEVLGVATSIKTAMHWFNASQKVDIIFADIELRDGQVFEVFRKTNCISNVVFITCYNEYLMKAFEVNCLDYLLKPIRKTDLQRCLSKFEHIHGQQILNNFNIEQLVEQFRLMTIPSSRSRFLIKQGTKYIPIELKDIAYFYSAGRYCYLMTWNNKNYIIDHSLDELEQIVDATLFYRANRSILVHLNAIVHINKDYNGKLRLGLNPPPKEEIFISKEKSSSFKNWISK